MKTSPEKKRIVHDRRVRLSFCPYCQTRLEMTRPERLQGDKASRHWLLPETWRFCSAT